MNNAPRVSIQYLVNYDLTITPANMSELNPLANLDQINNQFATIQGKKGFHLCGGSVDETTGEVKGCLLDGTYTLYSAEQNAYMGIMGNVLSRDDYKFINASDYQKTYELYPSDYNNATGTQIATAVYNANQSKTADLGQHRDIYCSADYDASATLDWVFKQGCVYSVDWHIFYEKIYTVASVSSSTSGTYYVATGSVDDLGRPTYERAVLPRDYNSSTTYYSVSTQDNSKYDISLKEQEQYILIRAKEPNTYIRSLFIYFDPVASEYATKLSFSNAKKFNGTEEVVDPTYSVATKYTNKATTFMFNFGQDSTLTQIQLNIEEWSKANALMKICKIVTGYTGIYTKDTGLKKFDLHIDKVSDANQLRFGVSSNSCSVEVLDKDLMINLLYEADLIYKDIQVQISVDGIMQGIFYINEKNSERGSNLWVFDCLDKLEQLKDIKMPRMPLGERTIYEIISYILSGLTLSVEWEISALAYCNQNKDKDMNALPVSQQVANPAPVITKSYFEPNQTFYDLLLKCCQVGLLRVYMDRNDICRITSGVN